MNKSNISLRGIFPPIPTPFDTEGELAIPKLVENLERWNQYDLAGYVVLGSNGEAAHLSAVEKVRVWEAARRAIPAGKLFIAGAGEASTRQTITLTHKAAQAGADAALLLTPHYYDGMMQPENLIYHYQMVADEAPVPVVLYNVPKFTHVDLGAGALKGCWKPVPPPSLPQMRRKDVEFWGGAHTSPQIPVFGIWGD